MEEVDCPEPGPGEILLRNAHCGVCGSDLHAYLNHPGYETIPERFTFGHEFSGEVVGVGSGVSDWQSGDRAAVISVQGCLSPECPYCSIGYSQLCPDRKIIGIHLDGGMAEYTVVRAPFLVRLEEGMDLLAASLAEPLSVAEHCVADCSDIREGELVLVTGPGIIGLLCALVARLKGAEVVISGLDSDARLRLRAAREIGFETLLAGSGASSLSEQMKQRFGRLADRQIEASGSADALRQGVEAVRPLGSVTVVGLFPELVQLNMTNLVRNQIDIRTSYVSDRLNYERSLAILCSGDIPVARLVRAYDLADGIRAFEDAHAKDVIKPVLACNDF